MTKKDNKAKVKRTHYIIYHNNIHGHLLAAIATKYIKENWQEDTIKYLVDINKHGSQEFSLTVASKKDVDWVWILGCMPSEGTILLSDGHVKQKKPAKAIWFDNHTGMHQISLNKKSPYKCFLSMYYDSDGFRGNTDELGQKVWTYCFPNKPVPKLITWIDFWYAGIRPHYVRAFILGLKLVETNPQEEATGDIWNHLFDITNPVKWGEEELTEEQIFNSMKTDPSYQMMNMGSVIDTYLTIKTQDLIWQQMFHPYTFYRKDKTRVNLLLVNSDDVDIETVYTYFTNAKVFSSFVGWWFYVPYGKNKGTYELHLLSTSAESAIDFANEVGEGYGNDNYAVCRVQTLIHDQWFTPFKLTKRNANDNYTDDNGNIWSRSIRTYNSRTSECNDKDAVEDDFSNDSCNDG